MIEPDEDEDREVFPERVEDPEPGAFRGYREPIPTVDDEEPPEVVDYRDWSPETTRVVSGPLGPVTKFPGQRFRSRVEARRYWTERAGRIIEDLSIRGRWIFRIKRDAC